MLIALQNLVLNRRHRNLSIILSVQYWQHWNAIPMPLRKNASDVVLRHRPINAKELASIVDDIFALDRNKATAGAGVAYNFKKKRKDFDCPHCAAAFGRASTLTTHVRTVHEKRKDYDCPHCAAAFGRASGRARHVRTQHPGNNNSQDDDECPLCLDPLATAAATATTRCNHRFCRACIVEELGRSGECPMCRQQCAVADLN